MIIFMGLMSLELEISYLLVWVDGPSPKSKIMTKESSMAGFNEK